MTVNHGGVLKVNFFIAYLQLIMNSRGCSIDEAKTITFDLFFHHNEKQFGKQTYDHFIVAIEQLTNNHI